jgi:hypothetical protein
MSPSSSSTQPDPVSTQPYESMVADPSGPSMDLSENSSQQLSFIPPLRAPKLRLIDQPTQLGGVGDYARFAGYRDDVGVFCVTGAQPISSEATDRCDSDRYGPFGFHRWDEYSKMCNCGSADMPDPNMGHHLITMETIKWVDVIYDAAPVGYLLYFEHSTAELDEQVRLTTPTGTRTLQELFRIMVEWDFAHKELGNNELVSKTCSSILDSMGMPDEFRSWLLEDVDDQSVARYLRGNVRAKDRGLNVPPLPEMFDDWTTRLLTENIRQLGAHDA